MDKFVKPTSEQMFGCDIVEFKKSVEESITFKFPGPYMVAMSILSDAQELLERNRNEEVRQFINRAKWVIGTYCSKQEGK